MSVSLRRGQKISLTKPEGVTLTQIRVGLGWDAAPKKGLFGRKTQAIDLDTSCLLFNADGGLVDTVWFRHLRSKDGAVLHAGDDQTGAGEYEDEWIITDLSALPSHVAQLVFTVNAFTGQDFSQVHNAFCRMVDDITGQEFARYDLIGGGPHTAEIMAKVFRDGPGWSLSAIGAPVTGRTFRQLLPALESHL